MGVTPRRVTAVRPKLLERDVTLSCRGWLAIRGWGGIRLNSGLFPAAGNRRIRVGRKGMADWVFIRGRECMLVEFKAPGQKPTAEQEQFLQIAEINGTPAMYADSLEMLQEKYGKWFVR